MTIQRVGAKRGGVRRRKDSLRGESVLMTAKNCLSPEEIERIKEELNACLARADLKPTEVHNTGYELRHHYRATQYSDQAEFIDIGVLQPRSTVASVDPD